jgi:hypothetical protein
MFLCVANLLFQGHNYYTGINSALSVPNAIDHTIVLTYSRAWDFAVQKTSSLFLGFTLVFIGALYVLRIADARFALSAEGPSVKGSLETSSPGLVMITLGVLLIGFVIYNQSVIDYRPASPTYGATPNMQVGPGMRIPADGTEIKPK